jgi:cell division protein FtsB
MTKDSRRRAGHNVAADRPDAERRASPAPRTGAGRPERPRGGAAEARAPESTERPRGGAAEARAPASTERSRLTSRAAVLAVVLCAIALSLAYPVREYIAQRRQIDQLEAQRQAIAATLRGLEAEQQKLTSNAYVEQQARDRLHMCLPTQTCYVIINPAARTRPAVSAHAPGTPWYERLWHSVQQADKTSAR